MTAPVDEIASTRASLSWSVVASIFLPFALGYFLSYLFRAINAVTGPVLAADVGIGAADLGLLTSVYFLAFATLQLPLGWLLDRFGPRQVEAVLLLIAGLGAAVFATATSLAGLTLGRALIGLGVSCCMMAAFKVFAMWFPAQRLPTVNGVLLAVGAVGALAATTPVEWWLRSVADWRALFLLLAVACVVVALTVFVVVPDHPEPPAERGVSGRGGLLAIFRDGVFWRVGLGAATSQGANLAVGGLWLGPWLRDVAGLEPAAVAQSLMLMTAAMGVGFLTSGLLAERLSRIGIRPPVVASIGIAGFVLIMAMLGLGVRTPLWALLIGFGFLATTASLSYAILSQHFEQRLVARANTAQNLLVFLFAFAMQWGIGVIVGVWEDPSAQRYDPVGYQVAFLGVATLQAIALGFFITLLRRGPQRGR